MAGGVGAVVMYVLVEPSIRAAIAIEDARHEASHTGLGKASHHGGEIVTRGQQVYAGMLTAVVVGVLVGIAFALVNRHLGDRIAGTAAGPAAPVVVAALGFVSFTLAPAVVLPANPPSIGDPSTVGVRTMVYLGTIVCAVALTSVVVALSRARSLSPRNRVLAPALAAVGAVIVVTLATPNVADQVPGDVPASLLWEFRLGSLAQMGAMWFVMGAGYAWLSAAPDRGPTRRRAARRGPAASSSARSGA
ncbi:CbtA family protein [Nocardioides endophyticus]|uniref:CbtA family protein n=1 Tax=Nocardioides endophyticus TaxID=1353775 RepID=A0ABP8YA21_9ACTN